MKQGERPKERWRERKGKKWGKEKRNKELYT